MIFFSKLTHGIALKHTHFWVIIHEIEVR